MNYSVCCFLVNSDLLSFLIKVNLYYDVLIDVVTPPPAPEKEERRKNSLPVALF